MKTLFMIRHAKSSWAEIGKTDFERSLNDRGHKDAPIMAHRLRGMGVQPDLLVSSTAKRAITTALYFAKEFGIADADVRREGDIYEASESTILHIIRELPNDKNTVFIYGHNPTFTYFSNRFASKIIDNVPTCGIVKIELNADNWADFNEKTANVVDFMYPKEENN